MENVVIWSPPLLGRFKMNTDAECRPNQQPNNNDGVHPNDGVARGPSGYGE